MLMRAPLLSLVLTICPLLSPAADSASHWWKGNLHTHSHWSNGNDSASYTLKGDEIYVRARVTSSKQKADPANAAGELERAWTQPLTPEKP